MGFDLDVDGRDLARGGSSESPGGEQNFSD